MPPPVRIQEFTARIKLNMANGLGDKVFNGIKRADIPKMISDDSKGAGKVVKWFHDWDEGYTNHDLYITFHINFDCRKAVKEASHVVVAKLLNFLGLLADTVGSKLENSLRDGIQKEMPSWSAIASLQKVEVIYGHDNTKRW